MVKLAVAMWGECDLGTVGPVDCVLMVEDDVQRAASGDRAAAEAVLSRLLPRVRNLIRYLSRNDSDVDDLAQDCLVRILRVLPSFRGTGSLEAWTDRIVVRRIVCGAQEAPLGPCPATTSSRCRTAQYAG